MFLERTHLNRVRRSNIAWTWRSYSRCCSKWYRILAHHLCLTPLPMEDVCQLGSGFWMAWSRRHWHRVVWNCEVGGGSTFSFVAVSETMNLPFKTSQQLQAQCFTFSAIHFGPTQLSPRRELKGEAKPSPQSCLLLGERERERERECVCVRGRRRRTSEKMRRCCRKPSPLLVKSTLIMIAAASIVVGCSAAATPSVPDAQIKCDCNPCGCTQKPPPPPPKWPVPYCPPPPPAPYLYIVGTPGNLYPFDPNYYHSSARRSYAGLMPVFLVSGLLALWKIWWL